MQVKVLKSFVGYNRQFTAGTETEVPEEQFEQLNSAGLGKILEEIGGAVDFGRMNKEKLLEYAAEQGIEIDPSLTKKEIIERLTAEG